MMTVSISGKKKEAEANVFLHKGDIPSLLTMSVTVSKLDNRGLIISGHLTKINEICYSDVHVLLAFYHNCFCLSYEVFGEFIFQQNSSQQGWKKLGFLENVLRDF